MQDILGHVLNYWGLVELGEQDILWHSMRKTVRKQIMGEKHW